MNNNATPPNPAVEDPAQQTTPVLSSTRPEPALENRGNQANRRTNRHRAHPFW